MKEQYEEFKKLKIEFVKKNKTLIKTIYQSYTSGNLLFQRLTLWKSRNTWWIVTEKRCIDNITDIKKFDCLNNALNYANKIVKQLKRTAPHTWWLWTNIEEKPEQIIRFLSDNIFTKYRNRKNKRYKITHKI